MIHITSTEESVLVDKSMLTVALFCCYFISLKPVCKQRSRYNHWSDMLMLNADDISTDHFKDLLSRLSTSLQMFIPLWDI